VRVAILPRQWGGPDTPTTLSCAAGVERWLPGDLVAPAAYNRCATRSLPSPRPGATYGTPEGQLQGAKQFVMVGRRFAPKIEAARGVDHALRCRYA